MARKLQKLNCILRCSFFVFIHEVGLTTPFFALITMAKTGHYIASGKIGNVFGNDCVKKGSKSACYT